MPPPNSEIQADILRACLRREEEGGACGSAFLSGLLHHPDAHIHRALSVLVAGGLINENAGLTEAGRRQAISLTRAHRLLESYLQARDGLPLEQLHPEADRLEHSVSPLEIEKIADSLSHPRFDPHGDPIPTRRGGLPMITRVPLSKWPVGQEGRITHIEDEPVADCRELVSLGITRGARVRVLGEGSLWHHGRIIPVPTRLWKMVGIEQLAEGEAEGGDCRSLTEFCEGEAAEIVELDPACTGPSRHRMLDLGLVPGTRVVPDFSAAFGGPRTYRLRGTCIALRREQALGILARARREDRP